MIYNFDDFPCDDLPPVLTGALQECRKNIQAPVALNVAAMLSTASIATQGLRDVELPNGLVCPISLMFFSVAESGERKTATDNKFANAIREFEAEQATAFRQGEPAFKAAMMAWSLKKQMLESALAKALQNEFLGDSDANN